MDIDRLGSKADKIQEDWILPALNENWVNFSGAFANCGYYKDTLGTVHLRGVVKSGTIGVSIFSLPVGYRPAAQINVPSVSNSAFCMITVNPTTGDAAAGNVIPVTGNTAWVSLTGINFRASET
jgi:hypothetical protein